MTHIKEITLELYDKGLNGAGVECNWYAKVTYADQTVKYFVFDEPYFVKISDFFDLTKENPIVGMSFL